MHIHLVTPCTRPQNIPWIAWSIPIPPERYTWWIIYDGEELPDIEWPERAKPFAYRKQGSKWGNAQRNFALDRIHDGWVYFLDDDTFMHPGFWDLVQDQEADFIHFMQEKPGGKVRLEGKDVRPNRIDSGCFLVRRDCVGGIRWRENLYEADGMFAQEVFRRADSKQYLRQVGSVYNAIDK